MVIEDFDDSKKPPRAEMAQPRPTHLHGGDELGLLEDSDVLLHPRQRHAERSGELADRRTAAPEALEDHPSGGVREGGERAVDRRILNHRVQYRPQWRALSSPGG